jgi:enoyl-CoA hydratase/carnithine racemase
LITEVAAAPDVRVLLITASGPTFCSGYHLGALNANPAQADPDAPGSTTAYAALADRLDALPMATIAVINGSVYGGGVELAVSCDFRLGVTPSRMFIPVAKIGGQYLPNGMKRLVQRLGLGPAKRILMGGEHFDAEGMLRMGLLDEAVAREGLWPLAIAWSDRICGQAPLAVRAMKGFLNQISHGEFDEDAFRRSSEALRRTDDHKEGLAAIRSRREPVFHGH